MRIGLPKETKVLEHRVALTPGAVEALAHQGNTLCVERGAGEGSGLADDEYVAAGAQLCDAAGAWEADLVVKVKEPLPEEYKYLRPGLLLFTYLHLAAERILTDKLLQSETSAIAYETVQLPDGSLPLLAPMSEVAGRLATQVGAQFLEKQYGGRGVLLGGIPGVAPASVVILGGGQVGHNAAKIAVGMGAQVTILDINHARLQYLDDVYSGRLLTVASTEPNIRKAVTHADLLIGAVLVPGAKAPKLAPRDLLRTMKKGAVIVDVAVDQGGCVESIRPTTLADPVYLEEGVVHYGVPNMPGMTPRTSTFGLVNQTLPYVQKLASAGLDALKQDGSLAKGLNTHKGEVTYKAVADAFDMPFTPVGNVL